MRKIIALFTIIFSFLSPAIYAADLLQVNLIVFTHPNRAGFESEKWPKQLLNPSMAKALSLAPTSSPRVQYRTLSDTGMPNTIKRLNKLGYHVILNTSWLQPINGKWVHFTAGKDYTSDEGNTYSELNGFLQITSRGLFIASTRLFLTLPQHGLNTYTLTAKQGMKLNQATYFDHPLFGALVYLKRA